MLLDLAVATFPLVVLAGSEQYFEAESTKRNRVDSVLPRMPEALLKILPSIASHPLAIVAYVCLLFVWTHWVYRRSKSKDFLGALEKIPREQRDQFCRRSGYKYDELAHLPEHQRFKFLTRRYLLIAYVVTILAALLFGLAALIAYRTGQKEAGKMAKAIEAIEESRVELQRKFDSAQSSASFLARGVQGALESANTAARLMQNPELNLLAEHLEGLLQDFDARFGPQHSVQVELTLRTARATAANAKGQYTVALHLVTPADVESALQRTKTPIEDAVVLLQVCGDALYGQGKWPEALTNYSRIAALAPESPLSIEALFRMGECFLKVHDATEAVTSLNKAITILERLADRIEHPKGPVKDRMFISKLLAMALANRGLAHYQQRNFSEAIRDHTKAITIDEHLLSESDGERTDSLARHLCNRGFGYLALGHPEDALSDLDRAVELSKGLVIKERLPQFLNSYALSLIVRATAHSANGRSGLANQDLSTVLRLHVSSNLKDTARDILKNSEAPLNNAHNLE